MKIAVFGATGRSGVPFVRQALDRGHLVRAAGRSFEGVNIESENLEEVVCDVRDAAAVSRVIHETDAVVSLIGHSKDSSDTLLTQAAKVMISKMESDGPQRIVILTGAGVRYPQDQPGFIDKLIRFVLKTMQPVLLADSESYSRLIMDSSLDWTIVRAPMLTEKEGDGTYRVGYVGSGPGPKASRQNVATFILDELEKNEHLRDAPMVSDQ
jgi:putative NADH-flavin reductase